MYRYELEKIDLKSVARIWLVLGLLPGLLLGILTLFLFFATGLMSFWLALITGIFSICFYTLILTGLMTLTCWLYNYAVHKVGGVEISIKQVQSLAPTPINVTNDAFFD